MRETLEQIFGPVRELEHRPYAYRTSFPLEEVRLLLDDGRETVCAGSERGKGEKVRVSRAFDRGLSD